MELQEVKQVANVFYDIQRGEEIQTLQAKVLNKEGNVLTTMYPSGKIGEKLSPEQLLQADDKVNIRIRNNNINYRWSDCSFLINEQDNGIKQVVLTLEGKGININRREAYRLPYKRTVDMLIDNEKHTVLLDNISEVGIGFYSNTKLPQDSQVKLSLETELGVIDILAKIIRVNESDDMSKPINYGAIIVKVPKTISKFIMLEQRKLLKVKN